MYFFLGRLLNFFTKQNVIIFESFPELDGSPWMVYKELIRRGFEKKYNLVWVGNSNFKAPKDIKYVPFFGMTSLHQVLIREVYLFRAKVIIESNRPILKTNPRTFRLHTQHGAPLKAGSNFYKFALKDADAILSLSENTACLEKTIFSFPKDKIFTLGYPTNDRLFEKIDLYKNGFWEELTHTKKHFDKIIGWLPTHRRYWYNSRFDESKINPLGITLLKTNADYEKINYLMNAKNFLLAIQLHPAHMKNIPKQGYSNIVFIPQSLKDSKKISTTNLLQNFDALITDYSAAYHEYILLNKPIALSIDDYEEYSSKVGFNIDYFDWIKGVYLKDISDLMKFIEDVSNGIDSAKTEREKAKCRIHKYFDNHSTQRVVDFLVEKAKL